jgi:predicted nuclease with RNAse H fold/uncharacterized protein YprB with RNaseH-like and TPR domain/adenylate kinase family enzyme
MRSEGAEHLPDEGAARMIERTFLHLPGVGPLTENRLWKSGYMCWGDLDHAIRGGATVRDLFRSSDRQTKLFTSETVQRDRRSAAWLNCLDESRRALNEREYRFFLDLIKPANHWRLLPALQSEALYLDIETTGLSRELHYITVIGALYKNRFYQWVWPEPLDELAELMATAPLVVTFNGSRFDIPFLRSHAHAVPEPHAHVDLVHIANAAGLRGGQKVAEQKLGLSRDDEFEEFGGLEAVASWCRALYGDQSAYEQLLTYNRLDVEMMPRLAARLCALLESQATGRVLEENCRVATPIKTVQRNHSFADLQTAWAERRPGLHRLEPKLARRFGRSPVVVGIDLRAKPLRPTGFARCVGAEVETKILFTDDEIFEQTRLARPDLVSIDAPLFLPRGRQSVSDDSPCRAVGGIVRDAERILWSRRIPVYPALIRQMQGLTQRGIELARRLEAEGIRVIESYPGAAQDILGIPRKGLDEKLLDRGLRQFGFRIAGEKSHDELDAITSALVGYFYLADDFEAIGAEDEGYMVIPRWATKMNWANANSVSRIVRTASLVGLPGAGKTTLCRALSERLGWHCFVLGDALREQAKIDADLAETLGKGELAPESLVDGLVRNTVRELAEPGLVLDGFPRHRRQLETARQLFNPWTVLYLEIDKSLAEQRLASRLTCVACGFVSTDSTTKLECPVCGSQSLRPRNDDQSRVLLRRLSESNARLVELLDSIPDTDVIAIDASRGVTEVTDEAVFKLMSTRHI